MQSLSAGREADVPHQCGAGYDPNLTSCKLTAFLIVLGYLYVHGLNIEP
jgi:hypothetical protein